MPGNLTFIEETHQYFLDGRELPGVTSILKGLGLINDQWYNDYACERGRIVHMAVMLYNRGTLDESTVAPVIRPYLDAYKLFLADTGFKADRFEKPVHANLYAGTYDLLGRLHGIYTLIDIKSGAIPKWCALQTAAYDWCIRTDKTYTTKPAMRMGLHLKDNGKYTAKPYSDPRDTDNWMACLRVHGLKG